MRSKKQNKGYYLGKTGGVRTAVDFCPNGCVNLHFGATVIHLPESDFVAFHEMVTRVAEDLQQEACVAVLQHHREREFH